MARVARLDLLATFTCVDIAELVDAFAGDYYHDCYVWFCTTHAPFYCSVCLRRCCPAHCGFTIDNGPLCPDCTQPSSPDSELSASDAPSP
jgi:hypothetical protein